MERYRNTFQIFRGSCSRNYGGELTLVNILGHNDRHDHLSSTPFATKGTCIKKNCKIHDDYLRRTRVNATKCYHENILIFILKVGIYVVLQFCPWCKFYFPLFKTHYHTLSYITIPPKQRKIKFAPRTKLHHNIYIYMAVFEINNIIALSALRNYDIFAVITIKKKNK